MRPRQLLPYENAARDSPAGSTLHHELRRNRVLIQRVIARHHSEPARRHEISLLVLGLVVADRHAVQRLRGQGEDAALENARPGPLDQGRVDLVFEINEGNVTGVQRISFVGNEHFSDGTLRGKIRTSESAWYRFLSSDDRYDPDRLNLDRELLRKFYLTEGYADFRVVSAVAELAPNREGFFITFTINEGERYKFGKIDVTSRFTGLDVDTLKVLGPGDSNNGL